MKHALQPMVIHPLDNVEIHGDGHKYARAWERIETPAAASALCGVIDIQLHSDKHFMPRSFAATCGGEPAFATLSSTPPPAWLFRNEWNMVRVVRRGAGTPSEWVRCDIKHDSFAIRVR